MDTMQKDTLNKARPQVVIVGGGFGGLQAARALRNAPVQVTVVDRTNHHLFQPLLYQVATAGLSPADIAAPIRHILRGQRNAEVLMAEVIGVDTQQRRVLLHDNWLPYDYLVLATGARESYFGHEEWAQWATSLKSIPDATDLRSKILQAFEAAELETDPEERAALLTFVLVGAGPTGVEMAGAIAELARKSLAGEFQRFDPRSARILLLEAGPRILAAFTENLAHKAHEALTRMGVEVRTNSAVECVDEQGVIVKGERIASRTVIWTAGVVASAAGKWLDVEVDRAGRVKVAPDLSVPAHPEVFVIGDTASLFQDGKPLPGVAPVAMQQGRYVASVIRSRVTGRPTPPPFHYHDKGNVATVGRSFAIVEAGRARLSGFLAWLLWLIIHIFYLIGFRNRLLVLFEWAWAYFTFQRGARLITRESPLGRPPTLPAAPEEHCARIKG
ncbi:MAG TPA: NAD(P)/FAD-dependent oxidoreductase [Chthonomonadaceae bacterium]|nr:NAD(P)/FAD-dependent oxidoreductase [Chthonomonadaceae bacterium]